MILTSIEIKTIQKMLADISSAKYPFELAFHEQETFVEFVSKHPHFLFPFGFDQAIVVENSQQAGSDLATRFHIIERNVFTPSINFRALLKRENSNQWVILHSRLKRDNWNSDEPPSHFIFISETNLESQLDLEDFRNGLSYTTEGGIILDNENILIANVNSVLDVLILNSTISNTARAIIQKLYTNRIKLFDISWKELEDILEEIFKNKGLKVEKTKRTRDGGRDLIVSGELFPGEEAQMAVEITAQKTVGIAKAAKAIHQNRHFPFLMLATSGQFSSGVYKTANEPEFQYRLKLRDGKSISEWINEYNK